MSEELTSDQKKEIFKKQPKEVQWGIVKPFINMFGSAVSRKMGVLPSLSAVAIAMLIVATLAPEVVPISILQARILISILLFIIPFSLIVYIIDVNTEAEKALECYKEYTGIDIREKIMTKESKLSYLWRYISGSSPLIIAIIYLLIVIFLLYIIWF